MVVNLLSITYMRSSYHVKGIPLFRMSKPFEFNYNLTRVLLNIHQATH